MVAFENADKHPLSRLMNIHLTLDYQTILRNEPRPVNLVAKLTAPKLETHGRSCQSTHLVRIQGTQNTKEVILNREVIAVLADQAAGKATREAAEKVREGDFDEAARSIRTAVAAVHNLAAPELTEDANNLLDETLCKLVARDVTARDLKTMVYESSIRTRPSNRTLNTGSRKKSKLAAKPTAEEK